MLKDKAIIIVIGSMETLNNFAIEAAKGFEQNGIKSILLSISTDENINSNNINNICNTYDVIGALTLNNVALLIEVNGENLWEKYKLKVLNWLVDHPINFSPYIKLSPANTIFLCIDRTHVDYMSKLWADKKCLFLPHAGVVITDHNPADFCERDMDICYFGTVKYNISNPDPVVSNRLNNDPTFSWMVEQYINNPAQVSYYDLFQTMLSKFDESINDHEVMLNMLCSYYFAWDFGVTYYRQYLIRALAKMGLRIHVFGNNWDDIVKGDNNITYHGLISPQKCIEYMGRSKIVLNNMPGFVDGSHERVFNSMISGAVCCSDYSIYLGEQFNNLQDILFYDLKNLQKTAYQLEDIMCDKVRWQEISNSGRQKALERHTYKQRISELIELLK